MTGLKHDLALAVRRLVEAPQLAALVIGTLALGLGFTTIVFTLVEALVLRPLPFPEPGRLVLLWETRPDGSTMTASYPNFLDWRKQTRSFDHLAIYGVEECTVRGEQDQVPCAMVSAEYFSALGVQPELGRLFTPAEAPEAPVAVVSHGFWQRRFHGDPRALGQTLEVNQAAFRIVGILPRGFRGLDSPAEVFLPVTLFDVLHPVLRRVDVLHDSNMHWGRVVGRLAPGTDLAQARADLRTVASRLATYSDSLPGSGIDLADARERLLGGLRPHLLRLMGAVTFVLLIACANAGHLLLTRAAERDREMAVRAALGATRWRIVRLWLVEGLPLGLAGGAAGLLLAIVGLHLLQAAMPLQLPAAVESGIDRPAFAFALGISLLASLLAGMVPALHATGPDLAESLKQGGRGATESPARRRIRQLLVTANMAFASVLLIGGGLMLRSLERILHYDPGFRSHGVLTLSFEPPSRLSAAGRIRIKHEILKRAGSLPGVRSAALTSHVLFDEPPLIMDVAAEGPRAAELVQVQTFFVSAGYFRTLGIPLQRGRGFLPADDRPPRRTVIVNQAFAERSWPGGDPVGRRITIGPFIPGNPTYEVVGVAGNVRTAIAPGAPPAPLQMYQLGLEEPYWGSRLVLATEGDPAALAPEVRRDLRGIDPGLAVFNVARLADHVAQATAATRFFTVLMGLFAGLALLLAVLGIYGLVSYTVQRESREIAIRRLLGASPWVVLRLLMARALVPAFLGMALGVGSALALSRTLAALLFDITPLDPATFLSVTLLFAAVALAASLVSAQKALDIDPTVALRDEA